METTYKIADLNHPFTGLYNHTCHNPRHFCACHKVWLSEQDSQIRCCRDRKGDDGSCHRCEAFLEDKYDEGIDGLLRKIRRTNHKGSPRYY